MSFYSDVETDGHMPRICIELTTLSSSNLAKATGIPGLDSLQSTEIDTFISYDFDSNIMVPCDTFSFQFSMPDRQGALNELMQEGDIIILKARGTGLFSPDIQLWKGIIDTIEVQTDEKGETITVNGRDFLSQFVDQSAVNNFNKPINFKLIPVLQGVQALCANTRISPNTIILQNLPPSAINPQVLATELGESKMQALQRFLEPINCLAWMNSQGQLVIGKPTMFPTSVDNVIVCSRSEAKCNTMNIRAVRSAASIPNIVIAMCSIQGLSQAIDETEASYKAYNSAAGPSRLLKLDHKVPLVITVANPDPLNTGALGTLINVGGLPQFLQTYAEREIARRNVEELQVQATMMGHFNELSGDPFLIDNVYWVQYDGNDVAEFMYLYRVQYHMDPTNGPSTTLHFTRCHTIVAGTLAIPSL